MRVIVLGAAGFIGSRMASSLAEEGNLGGRVISELVLFDRRPAPVPVRARCRCIVVHGDLSDSEILDLLFATPVDGIVHLAATLTLEAEKDFRLGLETNVLAVVSLLERCRLSSTPPLVLFASSISTFGGKLPPIVDDDAFQAPTSSYGTQKLIAEQLLTDYSRQGFIDGRALRLPIVLTHPGPPTGSISDQVASLIREPLRGMRAVCRIAPDSRVAVASVDNVVQSFHKLAALPSGALREARTMNLPGLTVTPAQIVQAVRLHLPAQAEDLVKWDPDPLVQNVIDSWPAGFTSARALALGFTADASVESAIAGFLASEQDRG